MTREVAFYRSRDARGSRMLTITLDGDTVRIGGQDLGAGVSQAFGDTIREYEWEWTMSAVDTERAVELLGGTPGADLVAALRRWAEASEGRAPGQFLKEGGLQLRFWSRMGD